MCIYPYKYTSEYDINILSILVLLHSASQDVEMHKNNTLFCDFMAMLDPVNRLVESAT